MLLYDRPCHGYMIMELMQVRLGKVISPGIIYPFLASLMKSGYLTSKNEGNGRRVRILYTMTPRGRRLSERVFKRLSKIVSVAISPNPSYCAHCGCKLYEPGDVEVIEGHEVIFCCVHCAAAYKHE